MKIRLHAFEPASRSNGPGLRAVVWFQGCTLGCAGCFNPATHDPHGGYLADTKTLAARILAATGQIEGVSISGGEPFQQADALLDLVERTAASGLSRLLFTGYTLREVQRRTLGPQILAHLDVLIAGCYIASERLATGLLGSANQQIHLLTSRYSPADFSNIPGGELILHRDGTLCITGIHPIRGIRTDGTRATPVAARHGPCSSSR